MSCKAQDAPHRGGGRPTRLSGPRLRTQSKHTPLLPFFQDSLSVASTRSPGPDPRPPSWGLQPTDSCSPRPLLPSAAPAAALAPGPQPTTPSPSLRPHQRLPAPWSPAPPRLLQSTVSLSRPLVEPTAGSLPRLQEAASLQLPCREPGTRWVPARHADLLTPLPSVNPSGARTEPHSPSVGTQGLPEPPASAEPMNENSHEAAPVLANLGTASPACRHADPVPWDPGVQMASSSLRLSTKQLWAEQVDRAL